MIPTAKEFLESKHIEGSSRRCEAMIEFAKLHCIEQAKIISENATVTPIDHEEISEGSFRPIWGVDDDSILNAYSLNLIK